MKLTDAQIVELAPDWATHYKIQSDEVTLFESEEFYQYCEDGKLGKVKHSQLEVGIAKHSIPIPRKPTNKLPNNTAVLRSEVKAQTALDAMAKVAEYNGFDMSLQGDCHFEDYDCDIIALIENCKCFQNQRRSYEHLNIITLKEFLSYGENKVEEINETPMPPVKEPKLVGAFTDFVTSKPPIEQIADIMHREGITSLTLHMISTGQVTGSFDVESEVKK